MKTYKGYTQGMLTVVSERYKRRDGKYWIDCRCSCGKHCRKRESDFLLRNVRSCGCYRGIRMQEYHRIHEYKGVKYNMTELAALWGLPSRFISYHLRKGRDIEEIAELAEARQKREKQ